MLHLLPTSALLRELRTRDREDQPDNPDEMVEIAYEVLSRDDTTDADLEYTIGVLRKHGADPFLYC